MLNQALIEAGGGVVLVLSVSWLPCCLWSCLSLWDCAVNQGKKGKNRENRLLIFTVQLNPPPGLLRGAQQLQKHNRKVDVLGNRDEDTVLSEDITASAHGNNA